MNKNKIRKRLGRYGLVLLLVLMTTALVTGGLLSYFGKVETTATAVQMVTIDGKNWDYTIKHSFTVSGGCSACFKHTIKNNGCSAINLTWNTIGSPDLVGISVAFATGGHDGDCPSCDGYSTPLALPFKLNSGQSIDICICYRFANMIMPGVYVITSTLVEA